MFCLIYNFLTILTKVFMKTTLKLIALSLVVFLVSCTSTPSIDTSTTNTKTQVTADSAQTTAKPVTK